MMCLTSQNLKDLALMILGMVSQEIGTSQKLRRRSNKHLECLTFSLTWNSMMSFDASGPDSGEVLDFLLLRKSFKFC